MTTRRNSFRTDFIGPSLAKGHPPHQHGTYPINANASGHARQLIGNVITNNTFAASESSITHVLWKAVYDSQSNQDQDYCYEGTRKGLLDEILSEINSPGGGGLIWLTGPAGFGKSAIAKTICYSLDHPPKQDGVDFESMSYTSKFQLGASYFFRRADTERSNVNKMILTMAEQLSERVDGFRSPPRGFKERIAQIDSRKLFKDLVREPFEQLSRRLIAIVIDALDECITLDESITSWETVVKLFSELRDIPESSACVRIIFTGRPQKRIQDVLHSLQPRLTVDLDNEDIVQASQEDISIFLQHKLKAFCRREFHPSTADCTKCEWPSREDFNRAVQLATTPKPLFIYAVTMCRFIGSDNAEPRSRLQKWLEANSEIISLTTASSSTQYQLFSMYRTFFQEVEKTDGLTVDEVEKLRRLLHGVLVVGNDLPMRGLLLLLGLVRPDRRHIGSEPEDLSLLRKNLRPILDIPVDMGLDSVLKAHHKSLIDFLEQATPNDSKLYPFNKKRSGLEFGKSCLAFLSSILGHNYREVDECAARVADYAFHHWPSFLVQGADEIDNHTGKMITEFLKYHFVASFRFSRGIYDAKELSDSLYRLSKVMNYMFC